METAASMQSISTDEPVLIELLNTCSSRGRGVDDDLRDEAKAREWVIDHGGPGSTGDIADIRHFRTTVAGYLRGEVAAEALDPWLARIRRVLVLLDGELGWDTLAPLEAAISARALLELAELQRGGVSRIRPCANPDCVQFFIDRSKANARKWCDMAICGNRTKARRYYERTVRAQQAAVARQVTQTPHPRAHPHQPATPRVTRTVVRASPRLSRIPLPAQPH
jgi:predicted RNA-binding Zn ribbon-like protein